MAVPVDLKERKRKRDLFRAIQDCLGCLGIEDSLGVLLTCNDVGVYGSLLLARTVQSPSSWSRTMSLPQPFAWLQGRQEAVVAVAFSDIKFREGLVRMELEHPIVLTLQTCFQVVIGVTVTGLAAAAKRREAKEARETDRKSVV